MAENKRNGMGDGDGETNEVPQESGNRHPELDPSMLREPKEQK